MKLKTGLCFLFVAAAAHGQITAPPQEPVVVTNRDVFKEAAFKETVTALPKVEPVARPLDLRGEVLECRSNVMVVRTFAMKNIYGPVPPSSLPNLGNVSSHLYEPPPMRPVIGQKKKYGPVAALRGLPISISFTNGQDIAYRALMTGTYVWGESLIELYEVEPPAVKIQ